MVNFDNLERALRDWVHEAVTRLSDGPELDVWRDLRHWRRDSDGVFRERERPVRVWNHTEIEGLKQLSTWPAVEEALRDDDRLRGQLDQLVGSMGGGGRFDAETAARHVLPAPDEVGDLEGTFARRYGELDRFLAAEELEYIVVWPLPGLTSSEFPIALEPGIELDVMTDEELAAVLDTDVLRLIFSRLAILPPEQDKQACLRYRHRQPKIVGDIKPEASEQSLVAEEQLNEIRDTLEQVFALLFADPIAISGRASFSAEWMPHSGMVVFQQVPLTQVQRFRQMRIDEQASAEIIEMWDQLRQPGLLHRQKALALALRRLSYQAHRQRVEDEMVDIMVAAEALYLSDLGTDELGFRLALRASALSDRQKLGTTRRNVFDLMRSAYRVRSTIVHGDVPKQKDLKVMGVQVSLADFVQATEDVVRQGLRHALNRAANPKGKWPPDWDGMTLPR